MSLDDIKGRDLPELTEEALAMIADDPMVGPLADHALKSISGLAIILVDHPEKSFLIGLACDPLSELLRKIKLKAEIRAELIMIGCPSVSKGNEED